MGFLSSLGKMIDQQISPGENTTRSLDSTDDPDKVQNFGKLGEFAKRIDQSAQRSYVESGYIRNVRPRTMEVMHQEPDVTIVVKKRMFSSLVDNYKFELMDSADKLFIRASKRLFKNKCQVISTYEQLTKVEKVIRNKGAIDEYMMPIISTLADTPLLRNQMSAKTRLAIETMQKLYHHSEPSQFTTWITERDNAFDPETGEGTGVFELTLVSNVSTTGSVEFGQGNGNLTIEDPYRMMVVTEADIDKAIVDAGNIIQQGFFDFTRRELEQLNNELNSLLSTARMRRGASQIKFITNDDTLLYKRLRAIVEEEGDEIFFNYQPPQPASALLGGAQPLFDTLTSPAGMVGILDPVELVRGVGKATEGAIDAIGEMGRMDVDIDQNNISEQNKLQGQEVSLFKQIVDNTFKLMNLRRTQDREMSEIMQTPEVEYVREKMRLHFANKPIIQPMDSVHVFISSKTRMDNKILGVKQSSFTANSLFGAINSTMENIEQTLGAVSSFFGNTNSGIDIEKTAVVGPDFPTWLWVLLRNDFTRQSAGIHVFGGLVVRSSSSYSAGSGKHSIVVGMKDNTEYFRMGQINLKPSVEVFNTALYDPLTPFELDFDASTGFLTGSVPELLPENIRLLESGMVRGVNGKYRNVSLTPTIYLAADGKLIKGKNNNLTFRREFCDPNGFVYRWKSGIGALTLFGDPHPSSSEEQERSVALTKNPFAGQDSMNVLSLLVTAQPYNFNAFVSGALKVGNLTRDDLRNEAGAVSYYRGLLSDLHKGNMAWGNFIPFKQLIVSEKSYKFMVGAQFDITEAHAQIDTLVRQRARIFDTLTQTTEGAAFASNPQIFNVDENGRLKNVADLPEARSSLASTGAQAAAQKLVQLDLDIARAESELLRKINRSNLGDGSLKIFGDDISFDSEAMTGGEPLTEESRLQQRKELRDKLNTLTLRRLWKVKANEDPNLFIVDDQYDKNYDIQAFEKTLAEGLQLLSSDYQDIYSQIDTVRKLLGLEVFADSQGHIRARPPGYNKVPSSVFYKMIREKEVTGKRLFPKLLEDLFLNQIEGLTDKIEITEDEIRLRTAKLGYTTDAGAQSFLSGSNWRNTGSSGATFTFKFITGESNGRISGHTYDNKTGALKRVFATDYRSIVQQSLPDLRDAVEDNALWPLSRVADSVNGQLQQTALFDISTQLNAINNPSIYNAAVATSSQSKVEQIRERLELKKTGKVVVPEVGKSGEGPASPRTQSDALKIINDLARLVSERQSLLKIYASTLKNAQQGININTDPKTTRALLYPKLYGREKIPSIIEHMIENEEVDDIGEGSGKRYVIEESQIISLSIEEKPPDFTVIEATGLFGEGLAIPPQNLKGTAGGNAVTTAWATDYDMWRMYGFKAPQPKMYPFLSNPDTQLAPMVVWLLNNERRKIFQGDLTIAGNEYMQQGEVIYLKDRDMLFYIESVSQSLDYSGNFQTRLKLVYGHNPGEYIPTMLDIVGKSLYSKKHQANLTRHVRHGNSDGSVPLNVLVTDGNTSDVQGLVSGTYGDNNRKMLTNLLLEVHNAIAPGLNKKLIIELRVYYNSKKGQSYANGSLLASATAATFWLYNPQVFSRSSDSVLPDDLGSLGLANNERVELVVKPVDLGAETESVEDAAHISVPARSPSSHAWHMARTLSTKTPVIGSGAANSIIPEAKTLFENVIDVWSRFETVDETVETNVYTIERLQGNQAATQRSQALETAEQQVMDTFYLRGERES